MGEQAPFVLRSSLILTVLTATWVAAAPAHEIPNEVVARMLARAEGQTFQLLVRVPLNSMRDVEVPEFGPGYLDIEAITPRLPELAVQWIAPFIEVAENGARLRPPRPSAVQISLPSDKSFIQFDQAVAHVTGPKPANRENLIWDQVLFDVLLEYPIEAATSEFAIRPGLQHLGSRVTTALRFELPGGVVRTYQFSEDPGRVPLDPSWFQASWRFVRLGFLHILDGIDHLLFLFCLVIPLRRLRPLVLIVTSFTIAHSVTLIASAAGFAPDALWFPPLVEMLIAISIVYMALENIVGATRSRWLVALGFGLVHGFGFSFALRETLQFAGSHLVSALLAFNVGVELGQLFVLLLLVPILAGLFRFVVAEKVGTIILSALAAHHAWHWSVERADVFGRFDTGWTAWPPETWWLAVSVILVVAGAVAVSRHWKASLRSRAE